MSNIILDIISEYLGLKQDIVIEACEKAQTSYKRYYIDKKNGGKRAIFHPSKLTKALQYAFIETVLSDLPVHNSAAAYVRGVKSPLLVNAEKHSPYPYSLRIDFTDFFPSIVPPDLIKIVRNAEKYKNITEEDEELMENALFVRSAGGQVGLAIGAPSSPLISNIVMYSIDEELIKLASTISPNSVYTRYADDIVFSTAQKGGCNLFYSECQKIIERIKSPKLSINFKKTIFSSKGSRRVITGLYVCPNGDISIGRENKRYIRKLLFDFKNGALPEDKRKYLSGYLSYILDVEQDYYNRLVIKYGADVVKNAHKLI